MKGLLLSVLLLLQIALLAQIHTHSDSLRGHLNENRSCFDVHYYELTFNFDIENKSIKGSNTIHFKTKKQCDKIQLDLFNEMSIDQVIFNGQRLRVERLNNAFLVYFDQDLLANTYYQLELKFSGQPIIAKNAPWDGGFVWSQDSLGNPWLGTAVQGIGASLFWPCKDHLSDEPDSMQIVGVVPDSLDFVCNGDWKGDVKLPKNKKMTIWKVSYPINTYNISLSVGKYVHFEDEYYTKDDTLKLDYYVLRYNLDKAKQHFKQVQPMLSAFEKRLGVYPFWNDGYALIETPFLGMEHQSGIAYGNEYKPGYRNRFYKGFEFDYIIIHETGHEYWGNSVSMNDIADMWIHESFCTYSEAIYVEELYGYEKMLEYMSHHQQKIMNDKPIQGPRDVNQPGSSDMYYKGAWMLQSMRHTLDNDSIWWSLLKGVQEEFKIKNVDRKEIVAYFKAHSSIDMTPIFNQFLDHTEAPVLEYRWLEQKDEEKTIGWQLSYKWSTECKDFNMPIKMKNGIYDFVLSPTNDWKKKDFKMEEKPNLKFGHEFHYFKKKEVK